METLVSTHVSSKKQTKTTILTGIAIIEPLVWILRNEEK